MPRKKKSGSQKSSSSKKRKSSSKKKSSLSACAKRRLASQKAIQMANDLCNSKPRRAWPALKPRRKSSSKSSDWTDYYSDYNRVFGKLYSTQAEVMSAAALGYRSDLEVSRLAKPLPTRRKGAKDTIGYPAGSY